MVRESGEAKGFGMAGVEAKDSGEMDETTTEIALGEEDASDLEVRLFLFGFAGDSAFERNEGFFGLLLCEVKQAHLVMRFGAIGVVSDETEVLDTGGSKGTEAAKGFSQMEANKKGVRLDIKAAFEGENGGLIAFLCA